MGDGSETIKQPLVLVDTFKTYRPYFVIDAAKLESVTIFKDSSAMTKFGVAARHGVLYIKTKGKPHLLRVDDIIRRYAVSSHDSKLRVCIDKILVKEPQFILIEASEIQDVHVTTDRYWNLLEDRNSGERFINIVTRGQRKAL